MKMFVSVCALIVFPFSFHSWASTPSSAQASENEIQTTKEVPEKVLYEMYFRRVAFFENLASKPGQGDLSRIKMRAAIMEELAINEVQRDILLQISRQALDEAAFLDAQAKEIINRERARYPGGEIKGQDQVPQIPAELNSLQQARDAIFTTAKSQLLNELGIAAFDKINSRIRTVILPNAKVINPK